MKNNNKKIVFCKIYTVGTKMIQKELTSRRNHRTSPKWPHPISKQATTELFSRDSRTKCIMQLKHAQRRRFWPQTTLGAKGQDTSRTWPEPQCQNSFRSGGSAVQEDLLLKPLTINGQVPKPFEENLSCKHFCMPALLPHKSLSETPEPLGRHRLEPCLLSPCTQTSQ